MLVVDPPVALSALRDEQLLAEQAIAVAERRRWDARLAQIAAEIARRSAPEFGLSGLAKRLGARTPEKLVQTTTGLSAAEAHALVRVGGLLEAETPLSPVAEALTAGTLSVAAADAIRGGLGDVADADAGRLQEAASLLVGAAPGMTPEQLASDARFLRATLDEEHVADRERAMRERRFLRLSLQPDGMTRLAGLLPPEEAAILRAAIDAATSPRRGGVEFTLPDAPADDAPADPRTADQVALDTLVDLARIAAEVDPEQILGAGRHGVRVLVTDADLARRAGIAQFEGVDVPVSIATVERLVCDVGTVPILFDSGGQVVNVGREQRLFTTRQRVGLAARDGGCRFPGCDRPPSWCEAHHIDHWARDGGRTDIADGLLLCRHHHRVVHDNGWEIERRGGEYRLIPPAGIDPSRRPIPMPARARIAKRLAS